MSYRDLLNYLRKLSDEQLDMDVTIRDDTVEEYYPLVGIGTATREDILEEHHPYLVVST